MAPAVDERGDTMPTWKPEPPPRRSAAARSAHGGPAAARASRSAPVDDDRALNGIDRADEVDTPAEVDAVFRTQRRIAVGYFAAFVGGMVLIPMAILATAWWGGQLSGRATGFVIAGAGLYLFFFVLSLGAASLANSVEQRMLGTPERDGDGP